jgi:hypothetical protein
MICEKSQEDLKDFLVVDHDHTTGIYRGILCKTCNLLLGKLKTNTLLITKMTEYLNK